MEETRIEHQGFSGNNWEVSVNDIQKRVFFPVIDRKTGKHKTVPRNIFNRFITLKHTSGDTVSFKFYEYRQAMRVKDLRDNQNVSTTFVFSEIARMTKGDMNQIYQWWKLIF